MTLTVPLLIGNDSTDGEGYRVARYPHGIAIFGPIPVSDFTSLEANWTANGYSILDTGVASAIGATFCVTSTEGSAAWRLEVEAEAVRRARGDDEMAWVLGWDTGYSSFLIMTMLGGPEAGNAAARRIALKKGDGDADVYRKPPQDPEDFGRCIRLLDRFVGWRERLDEVVAANPEWATIVRDWTEIEALYREELAAGGAMPKTTARMRRSAAHRDAFEATVYLDGLPIEGCEGEPYLEALDGILDTILDRNSELPDQLYLSIPPVPGATVLLWDRHGRSVYESVKQALARGDV